MNPFAENRNPLEEKIAGPETMSGDIGISEEYVLLRDQWDPETIHCIPRELAIAALRILALSQPPKPMAARNGNGHH